MHACGTRAITCTSQARLTHHVAAPCAAKQMADTPANVSAPVPSDGCLQRWGGGEGAGGGRPIIHPAADLPWAKLVVAGAGFRSWLPGGGLVPAGRGWHTSKRQWRGGASRAQRPDNHRRQRQRRSELDGGLRKFGNAAAGGGSQAGGGSGDQETRFSQPAARQHSPRSKPLAQNKHSTCPSLGLRMPERRRL